MEFSHSISIEERTKTLTESIVCHSASLAPPPKDTNNKSKKSYFELPEYVKIARANHSTAFETWKYNGFADTGETFYDYKSTRAFIVQNFVTL